MEWIQLKSEAQLEEIRKKSEDQPQVIFKHSTRCSISGVALKRLEKSTAPDGVAFYFLDLLQNRALSNKIAEQFKVWHESPQILVIRNGECVYDESHMGISMDMIVDQLKVAS
jgi:bacillithiol system protein YtxJ